MTGLATDGGLYVPEYLPQFSEDLITSWSSLTYEELAFKVMYPFVAVSYTHLTLPTTPYV